MGWVILEKQTGKAVCELPADADLSHLNTEKYEKVEAGEYLAKLNLKLNDGVTYRDKREAGLL